MVSKRKFVFTLWMLVVLLSLSACAELSNKDSEELETYNQFRESCEDEKTIDDYAKELLRTAFAYDVSDEDTPTIESAGDKTTIRYSYSSEPEKFYIVEIDKSLDFPAMVYNFSHIGEDEDFDLAKESSDYFNNDMISNAQDYVEKLYGIDCSNATIHAYGYKNKIAVQLEVKENQIFHVRYYYKELEPVGVVFYNDIAAFEKFLETYQAKKYL